MELRHCNQWGKAFWVKAEKHSTRLPRVGEKDNAGYSDVNTPNILPSDSHADILRKKQEKRSDIEQHCDIIYYMNNELYGFNTANILRQLDRSHVAIVLSDLGVIKQLKENPAYGLTDRVVTLYVSSCVNKNELTDVWLSRYCDFQGKKKDKNDFTNIENTAHKNIDELLTSLENKMEALSQIHLQNTVEGYEQFKQFYFLLEDVVEIQEALMPDNASYSVRVERLKNFYFKYIIDIGLFDYVILNYFDVREDNPTDEKMSLQAKNIIDYIEKTNAEKKESGQDYISYNSKLRPQDAVFFVCAAPKSGKNILMKNLRVMSEKQIYVVEKQSLRMRKKSDGQDKMMPLIEQRNGESITEFEIRKAKIEEFTARANKIYNLHAEDVNKLKREIADLRDSDDPDSQYILSGKEARLKAIETEFVAVEEKMLIEARTFFDGNFTEWNWRFHGTYYGIDLPAIRHYSKEVREAKDEPVIPVIMISNMQQLRSARRLLGNRLIPIFLTYVATDKSNYKYHMDLAKNGTYKNENEALKILQEIDFVRNEYFNNIGEFRHVLLNSGVEEDLHDQIINIVRLYGGRNGTI